MFRSARNSACTEKIVQTQLGKGSQNLGTPGTKRERDNAKQESKMYLTLGPKHYSNYSYCKRDTATV